MNKNEILRSIGRHLTGIYVEDLSTAEHNILGILVKEKILKVVKESEVTPDGGDLPIVEFNNEQDWVRGSIIVP